MRNLLLLLSIGMLYTATSCTKDEITIEPTTIECNRYNVVKVWDIFNEPTLQRAWLWNSSTEHLIDSLVPKKTFLRGDNICL